MVASNVSDSPPKPSITDVLPTEIMEQIIEEVRAQPLSVFSTSRYQPCRGQVHALMHDKYVRYVALRLVSKSFNALVEPTVFRSVTFDLSDHFDDITPVTGHPGSPGARIAQRHTSKKQRHANKIDSLALLGDAPSASTLTEPREESRKGGDVVNIWRWAKSLTITEYPGFQAYRNINQARLETLIRAIRGLKAIELVQ